MFRPSDPLVSYNSWQYQFLTYTCRNCGLGSVRFAIGFVFSLKVSSSNTVPATAIKFGQNPAFGPQTPAKLLKLIGPDREIFLQGRRAENRGLGIGAFAYYRRVVENQKNRILAQIAKVATVIGSSP
jgi:hypothetical protein